MKTKMHALVAIVFSLLIVDVMSFSVPRLSQAQGMTITLASTALGNTAPLPTLETETGTLPTDCPIGPEPMFLSTRFAPGVGGYPVWAVGGITNGILNLDEVGGSQFWPPYGFPVKILWVVKESFNGKVKLHGKNLQTGEPLWFSFSGSDATTMPELGVTNTAINALESWNENPSYLFIPKAGCYQLEAEWNGGMWRFTFPAGRTPVYTPTP